MTTATEERVKQTHIGAYVPADRAARLAAIARRENRSLSSVLRRAIDRELELDRDEEGGTG